MEPTTGATERPARMLTNSNKDLARDGIWTFTLPALAAVLPDGQTIKTCPAAGKCAAICYARSGSYTWANVKAAHVRNLAYVIEDPDGWQQAMTKELAYKRFVGKSVRVHDAGDYFSDDYTRRWLEIMRATPGTFFYSYTKEVDRFRRLVEPEPPENFKWVFSLGGRQDNLLDLGRDRVADVFPDEESIAAAGHHSQAASDLLAVLGPAPVGMRANNIPRFRKRQGNRTLGEWQAEGEDRSPATPQN